MEQIIYLGPYTIDSTRPLRTELACKIPGVGFRNVDYILSSSLGSKVLKRNICYKDLSESQSAILENLFTQNKVQSKAFYANKRCIKHPASLKLETELDQESQYIMLGNKLFSQMKLDQKRLISLNSYVGRRLKTLGSNNTKVHGQRTRSTGRRNKTVKGFQKNKKKLHEKT